MNYWAWVMELFPVATLIAGLVGLLIWVLSRWQGVTARSRVSAIWGVILATVLGMFVWQAVLMVPGTQATETLKFGQNRAEIDAEVSRRAESEIGVREIGVAYPVGLVYQRVRLEMLPLFGLNIFVQSWIFFGCIFVVVRLLGTDKILRSCTEAPERVLHILGDLERDQDHEGRSWVAVSDQSTIPWTSTLGRKIVLPSASEEWSDEEIRISLRHELAHIRERHGSMSLVLEVLVCLGWCFPWMWLMRRDVMRLLEYAADEVVVAHESQASYADLLLRLAKGRSTSAPTALAMVSQSELSERIGRVLAGAFGRAWDSKKSVYVGAAFALSLGAVVTLSARSYGRGVVPAEVVQKQTYAKDHKVSKGTGWQATLRNGDQIRLREFVVKKDGKFMAFHPARGYLETDYQWYRKGDDFDKDVSIRFDMMRQGGSQLVGGVESDAGYIVETAGQVMNLDVLDGRTKDSVSIFVLSGAFELKGSYSESGNGVRSSTDKMTHFGDLGFGVGDWKDGDVPLDTRPYQRVGSLDPPAEFHYIEKNSELGVRRRVDFVMRDGSLVPAEGFRRDVAGGTLYRWVANVDVADVVRVDYLEQQVEEIEFEIPEEIRVSR